MRVTIDRLDHLGRGIAMVSNKVTFVPKTVPEDICEIEITKSKKNYQEGTLKELIKPGKARVKAKCPYYDLCGGCSLQNLSYTDTLEYKKNKVIDIFKRKKISLKTIVIASDNPYNYRNKIELKIKNKKIGFYQEKTNNIIAINKCLVTSDAINKVIPFISKWNITNGEVILRCNENKEVLIIINTKDKVNIDIDTLKKTIKLGGIVVNRKTIYGENFLFEIVNGLLYKVSFDSFFQINLPVAAKMFKIVLENIKPNVRVLDLYCGVGTFSLTVARKAKEVVGIEIIPNAVINAINNGRINKIDNVKFVLNDVRDAISKIKQDFDTWIIDPPRSGIDKNTIQVIRENKPSKIIYVSCNPQTLARDVDYLKDIYKIDKFYILDMFSFSYHVESICILRRI